MYEVGDIAEDCAVPLGIIAGSARQLLDLQALEDGLIDGLIVEDAAEGSISNENVDVFEDERLGDTYRRAPVDTPDSALAAIFIGVCSGGGNAND